MIFLGQDGCPAFVYTLEFTQQDQVTIHEGLLLDRVHLYLHKAVLSADALDADLGACIRVHHTSCRVIRVIVSNWLR